ncbi:ABC transporter permease [Microbacterium sp.]|uniref:ABC transporter permease n=1 Tax=Microbacterium sp. TaxID=51671 RepID=UPI0039E412FB
MTETAAAALEHVTVSRGVWTSLRRRPLFWISAAILAVLAVISLFPDAVGGLFGQPDPRACELRDSKQPPSAAHVFGTDLQGCDIYANVIHGARTSLFIGVTATVIALAIAIVVGTLAAYFGGFADILISRLTDVFLGFPFILGAIIVLNSVGERTPLVVAVVLAAFSWPTLARLVRTSVRTVRRMDYISAASAMGISHARTLVTHVVPNAIGPVLAITATMVGSIIVAESTLTFLGVGLRSPSISWGLQMANAQSYFGSSPHMLVFPALFLSVTVFALITLGDILRDALDPKGRRL